MSEGCAPFKHEPDHTIRRMLRRWIRRSPTLTVAYVLLDRRRASGSSYGAQWERLRASLERSPDREGWVSGACDGDEDAAVVSHGQVRVGRVAMAPAVGRWLAEQIDVAFPGARSVLQLGSGSGRELLALEGLRPNLDLRGVELTPEGVELSRAAAARFGSAVRYDVGDLTVLPRSTEPADIVITSYVLSELTTERRAKGIEAAIRLARRGAVFLEPVMDALPRSYLGLLGRLYAWKKQYASAIELGDLEGARVARHPFPTSNNALLWPSVHVVDLAGSARSDTGPVGERLR
jgi:hypothetical protein